MASLHRRNVVFGALAAGLAGCEQPMPLTASRTPRLDRGRLDSLVEAIAERARPAVLGAGLMNLESGEDWSFNGERPFPMQGVSRLPVAAGVLAEVDGGRLSLDERIELREEDLSPPYSPLAVAWPARRDYSAGELLSAAVSAGDNTAADVLLRRIGGPGAVNAWLQSRSVAGVRVDRYDREILCEMSGLASFRAAWRGEAAFARIRQGVAPELRRRAMLRYLADPRDTATPRGMIGLLERLTGLDLLSAASTGRLLRLLADPRASLRLRAHLPAGAVLAHVPGTAPTDLGLTAATNDVGVLTLKDGRRYALAVFLSGSAREEADRDRALAEVGRAAFRSIG